MMAMWMNLKVKTKAMVLVAVAVLTLLVIVPVGLLHMRDMAGNEEELSIAVKHVGMLNDLKNDLTLIRLDLVYMLVLEDQAKIAEKAQDIEKRKQSIQEGMAAFRKYDLDAKEK